MCCGLVLTHCFCCRITREIEQVVFSEAGQHALVMCADGGVVFYGAAVPDVAAADDAENGEPNASGLRGVLLELPGLFRIKDQQQHLGSWGLRRVGRHGTPVRSSFCGDQFCQLC
jgi:hypothetical protein